MNINSVSGLPSANKPKIETAEQQKLWDSAVEFESIFIKQMLDSMKKTLSKDKLVDGGMGEDIFDDMLYQERAHSMAKSGSLGLAKTLYHQLNQIESLKTAPKA